MGNVLKRSNCPVRCIRRDKIYLSKNGKRKLKMHEDLYAKIRLGFIWPDDCIIKYVGAKNKKMVFIKYFSMFFAYGVCRAFQDTLFIGLQNPYTDS